MITDEGWTEWASVEEMREAAEEIRAFADRVESPATRYKLFGAAEGLRWQAAWKERYG